MIEQDRYCIDVLTQIQAVSAALARVETEPVRNHIDECVQTALCGGSVKEQREKADVLIHLLLRAAE